MPFGTNGRDAQEPPTFAMAAAENPRRPHRTAARLRFRSEHRLSPVWGTAGSEPSFLALPASLHRHRRREFQRRAGVGVTNHNERGSPGRTRPTSADRSAYPLPTRATPGNHRPTDARGSNPTAGSVDPLQKTAT